MILIIILLKINIIEASRAQNANMAFFFAHVALTLPGTLYTEAGVGLWHNTASITVLVY